MFYRAKGKMKDIALTIRDHRKINSKGLILDINMNEKVVYQRGKE